MTHDYLRTKRRRKPGGSNKLRIVRKCFGVMSPAKTLHLDKLCPTRGECWAALEDDEDAWMTVPGYIIVLHRMGKTFEQSRREEGWRVVRVYLGVRI